ncbi:MAG: DUF3471 domain-containing protein, partial [Acidobacteriota bacterium]|nr:DUF3471 domain-containing protein [Acidobacteriota bacterium]
YSILDIRDANVQEVVYKHLGGETLQFAGNTYQTVMVNETHTKTGVRRHTWIDWESGRVVQGNLPNDRRFYLTGPGVVRQIQMANVNDDLLSKVGVLIADFQSIRYMKVRAVFHPTGLRPTPESLNISGQTFTGTVEGNRIEGIFEIRHPRYDGAGAPPFPPDFGEDESLGEYLEPSLLTESDDPVLVEKARELTRGARDSWDAARRVSTWVAHNIDAAIPGGGTARRTYDLRAGECGGHSALVAAMCRAVGIPARLAFGCQYIPNFGGAFGQHAWNEVYMGELVGWVPLDSTAEEPDYVDSGHIRIGDLQSTASALNPVEMEVLEYALAGGEVIVPTLGTEIATPGPGSKRYEAYLGRYSRPSGTLDITVENDRLVVDFDGRVALALGEPDHDGVWSCRSSSRVSVTFDRGEDGRVTTMALHERTRMRKTGEPDKADPKAPEEFRSHLGTYYLAAGDAEYVVAWRHGSLAIHDPNAGRFVRLNEDPDTQGTWISQASGNRVTFQNGPNGNVEQLTLDSTQSFKRL